MKSIFLSSPGLSILLEKMEEKGHPENTFPHLLCITIAYNYLAKFVRAWIYVFKIKTFQKFLLHFSRTVTKYFTSIF